MLGKPLDQCRVNIRFCSAHFESHMFTDHKRGKLVADAVPTLFKEVVLCPADSSDNQDSNHKKANTLPGKLSTDEICKLNSKYLDELVNYTVETKRCQKTIIPLKVNKLFLTPLSIIQL